MITPGIYRVRGYYTSPANIGIVEVIEVTKNGVKCRGARGSIVTLSHDHCNKLRWERLDESTAYGIDCRDGRCEW